MIKTIKYLLISILLCLQLQVSADDARVREILQQFENQEQPSWQLATRFLEALHNEDSGYVLVNFNAQSRENEICSEVYGNACDYFYHQRDYDKSIACGKKALNYCKGTQWEADCMNLLSMDHLGKSEYTQAASYAKQCYRLDAKTGDPDMMSSSLNTIAGIYMAANQPAEAKKYITEALDMAGKANNPARLAVIEGMASEIYHALVDDTEALKHINRACELEQQLGNTDKLLTRQVQKASVLNGLKLFSEAEQLLANALPRIKQLGDTHTLGIACNKMGMAIFSQHRPAEAVPYFRQAADIFVKMGDMGNELHARRGLYESLWSINPDSAKIELDRFDLLKDSIYRTASAQSLARFNAELNNDWLQQENHSQRTRAIYIIICVTLIASLIALGIWWWMHRRERSKVAALQFIIDDLEKKNAQAAHETVDDLTDEKPATHTIHTAGKELLGRIIETVMNALPDGDTSVEAIAGSMATTRGNLNRKVKEYTGMTTQQFLLQVRLEHACQLLKTTSLPIAEVGHECGFDNTVSFSRAFKRKTKLTPTDYRENQ